MDNQLKPTTKNIIQELNESNIRSIVATGDNLFTSVCVAKKCNIISATNPLVYANSVDYDQNYEKVINWQVINGDKHLSDTPRIVTTNHICSEESTQNDSEEQ